MNGLTFMGGKDIFQHFGLVIPKGGYNELLNYNELKAPITNDWPEHPGIETDLSVVRLNSRNINLPFYATNPDKAEAFLDFLENEEALVMSCLFLNKGYRLRFTGLNTLKVYRNGPREFTVIFTEDMPQRYAYVPVQLNQVIPQTSLMVDGISLRSLGLVYTGDSSLFLKRGSAKENLSRQIDSRDGLIYDAAGGYKARSVEISLPLVFHIRGPVVQKPKKGDFNNDYNGDFRITRWVQQMRRADMTVFMACYESFLGLLTQPGERLISYQGIAKKGYYKSANGFKILSVNPDIVVSFNLNLVLTQSEMND